MKKNIVAIFAALVLLFLEGYGLSQQTLKPLPTVTLSVLTDSGTPPENLTIARRNGSVSLMIGASASGGFNGTVAGTLSVAEPVNGDRIELAQGGRQKSYPFTLGPGDATPSTCKPPVKNCFTVVTSGSNDRAGEITYTVTVDPSKQYSLTDMSYRQVKITVR